MTYKIGDVFKSNLGNLFIIEKILDNDTYECLGISPKKSLFKIMTKIYIMNMKNEGNQKALTYINNMDKIQFLITYL